jgi:TatD DNase family protein
MFFVDSHCHIDGEQFENDRTEVIARARRAGVKTMLVVGTGDATEFENFERVIRLSETDEDIYCSIGIHPHDAKTFGQVEEEKLIGLAKSSKKVIGWGEIGLDYYYDYSPREVQREVFRRQIRIAKQLNLPIIIHSRESDHETVEILTQECGYPEFRGGILHCFGGTPEMAKDLMAIGFMISLAGNITFKKAENLRESAKIVPLDRLLIETDCPYLTPVPFRGKRNEPMYVVETAKFLADFYGVELEVLAERTTRNFYKFFQL